MLILMNVIAYLLILALIGLIATVTAIVLAAKLHVATAKKAMAMTDKPKDQVLEIANGLKGRALIMANRARRMATSCQDAASAVATSTNVVSTLVVDVVTHVDSVKAQAEGLGESIGNAEQSFLLFQQVAAILKGLKA